MFAEAKARGVLVRPLGDAVALSPPLVITPDEIGLAADAIGAALDAVGPALADAGGAPPAAGPPRLAGRP